MTNAETNLKTISIKNAEESLILKATMGKLTFDGNTLALDGTATIGGNAGSTLQTGTDVNNADVSKRYTHDTIRELSHYGGTKKVDLGFVGSCMVHKGDMKILAQMLRNLEAQHGEVEFQAPLVVAPPTYNIVDELRAEGDWELLSRYAGFEFDDTDPKSVARTGYENILYLERPGCNLCMGNQEKAEPGDTVMATSTRLFQGRVVRDSDEKKGESLLASTPVVVLSSVLGRTPTIEEYKAAVDGIDLTRFDPPTEELTATPVSIGR
ncbi:MAG: hypothetical protein EBY56_10040 [Actinobacteria bacterium]|nr:hypothetical protein [Actinomycetota bacterium]